ncbi:hypothetical protein [Rickettsia peacockii]|uniref:hypothetical protein n=1 Tax=Rickettsia peacockii TaxID=47589 RepID=UPI0016509D03|nr:hypothetical protein [Rickettsia peacockii]
MKLFIFPLSIAFPIKFPFTPLAPSILPVTVMSSSKLSTGVLLCKLILVAFNIVELSVADPSKTFTAANEPILPISHVIMLLLPRS